MAKKEIRWTLRSINDKLEIYEYWIHRNKSKTYSVKLDLLFTEAANLLANFPDSGKHTTVENVRVKTVRDYQLFYTLHENSITIITVWDSRRNPNKLKL